MPATRIVIVTPAAPGSRSGNRYTALRWARILRALGCRTTITTSWNEQRCDGIVVLHALRGHETLRAFRDAHPEKPALLALTGTDLYRDIHESEQARLSLDLATRLIVLQQAGPDQLAARHRARCHVLYQSEIARYPWMPPPQRLFRLCILGHLREEKDPLRGVMALRYLAPDLPIRLVQAGKALSEDMESQARYWMAREPRYRWYGELAHYRALRLLAGSHAMIISSRMEGGAHVVSEAIAHGVPVLASDIAGNRGMLGDDYGGYYPVGAQEALAELIHKVATDPPFLLALRDAVLRRRPLIAPRREIDGWRALLAKVGFHPS